MGNGDLGGFYKFPQVLGSPAAYYPVTGKDDGISSLVYQPCGLLDGPLVGARIGYRLDREGPLVLNLLFCYVRGQFQMTGPWLFHLGQLKGLSHHLWDEFAPLYLGIPFSNGPQEIGRASCRERV